MCKARPEFFAAAVDGDGGVGHAPKLRDLRKHREAPQGASGSLGRYLGDR